MTEKNKKIDISDYENDINNKTIKKFKKITNKEKNFKDKTNQIEEITSERKKMDTLKESTNNENNDTSVDIKTEFCDEKVNIKNTYFFINHGSSLQILYNSKQVIPTSKEIQENIIIQDREPNKKEITTIKLVEEKSTEKNVKNENDIDKNNGKVEDTPINDKKSEKYDNIPFTNSNNDINIINNFGNLNDFNNLFLNDSFYYNNIDDYDCKAICFKETMMFKNIEFERNYDLINNKEIFHTIIIYKDKECILLLKNEFLYILEIKQKLKEEEIKKPIKNDNNPELSLISQLHKEESLKNVDKTILKYDYDITNPLVCLNFNLLSCKILLNKNNNINCKKFEIQILILGTSTKFIIFFKNFEIYKKFIYILGSKIKNSNGDQTNTIGLSLRTKDFYKETYIRTKDFEKIAETGDLLLFRTLDCLSDCQRLFTRDEYDHIALVIRRNGIIELFEATSNENCSLLEWNKFKYRLYNLIFKKVVLRKLNIDEEDTLKYNEIRENIEIKSNEFIDKTLKKKYAMSVLKMVIDRKPKEYEKTGDWEKGKGYCCSALTAAFYIYNGVMKLEKSVHCIKPGDFEQDRNRVTILPGFSFGPEKIIEFSM